MLYTRKGDNGTTTIFGCNQKLSKSSAIAEALGTLDETNSFLGVIKSKSDKKTKEIIENIQNNLFVIQAQVAGADKKLKEDEIKIIEDIINGIEKKLPPIKSFLVSGTNEVSANFDFARTLVRRAERRVVEVSEEEAALQPTPARHDSAESKIDPQTLAYLNRLSSLLYAFARLFAGKKEKAPKY